METDFNRLGICLLDGLKVIKWRLTALQSGKESVVSRNIQSDISHLLFHTGILHNYPVEVIMILEFVTKRTIMKAEA